MGKKYYPKTKKTEWVDEDNIATVSHDDLVKRGYFGREAQYKYFSEHLDEITDEKLFSELEKKFGNDKERVE